MATKLSLLLATLMPLAALGACSSDITAPPGENDPYEPEEPGDTATRIEGTYEVRSTLDLRGANDGLAGVLAQIDELATNPAGIIMDLLEAQGNDMLSDLPGFIKSALVSQVNRLLLEDAQNAAQLRQLSATLDEMVQSFQAVSQMQIRRADASGNATASHRLQAISFRYQGQSTVVEVTNSELADMIAVNARFSQGRIDIGAHELSLPVGAVGAVAFEAALEAGGVSGLDALFAEAIDCPALAAQVGDIKLDTFTLISQSQLASLCNTALRAAADQVLNQLESINMDVAVMGGQGTLERNGGNVSGIRGSWDFMLGSQALPSDFEANRR